MDCFAYFSNRIITTVICSSVYWLFLNIDNLSVKLFKFYWNMTKSIFISTLLPGNLHRRKGIMPIRPLTMSVCQDRETVCTVFKLFARSLKTFIIIYICIYIYVNLLRFWAKATTCSLSVFQTPIVVVLMKIFHSKRQQTYSRLAVHQHFISNCSYYELFICY